MFPETQRDAVQRLERDFKFKNKGKYLRDGVCPNCSQKQLWAYAESPWKIQCTRLNNCGYEFYLRDQYPDLFEQWEKRFPSKENPTATVDAYLSEGRGFHLEKLKGLYTQEYYKDYDLKIGSVTVRFPIGQGDKAGWFERLVDHKKPLPKTRNKPGWSSGGHSWVPPGIEWHSQKEIWVTEGLFDAIALWLAGIPAIAVLGAENYPKYFLEQLASDCSTHNTKRPKLVWAFDADNSGRIGIERNIGTAKEQGWDSAAAQPRLAYNKQDWNDLYKQDRLKHSDLESYRYYGALLIAPKPVDKALLIYNRYGAKTKSFPFDHGNRTYWFKLDLDKFEEAFNKATSDQDEWLEAEKPERLDEAREMALKNSNTVTEIINCKLTPLYYQYLEDSDEAWYFFNVDFPRHGKPVKNTFTGGQLSSASEFKKRLLSIAPGVIYTGNGTQLDRLLSRHLETIRRVQLINYVGYQTALKTYVLNDIAVHAGKLYFRNKDEFFELPRKVNLKSNAPFKVEVNPEKSHYKADWIQDMIAAYGVKGLICLTGWFGSLFAQQIRAKHKSFPFMEIVGQPGTGKTTFVKFLWRLFGRDNYEGVDPTKTSESGLLRTFRQVSNLPVVLVESDREGKSKNTYNFDQLKTLYDGGSLGARGVKDHSNETYEPPFMGSVVISQNSPVETSEAMIGRIVHIGFVKKDLTKPSLYASRRLTAHTQEEVTYFMVQSLLKEAEILATFERSYAINDKALHDMDVIKVSRIVQNYAQFMALFEAMREHVLPSIPDDVAAQVHDRLAEMAIERDKKLETEPEIVSQFWDAYQHIEATRTDPTRNTVLNHSRKDYLVAINFTHMYQVANQLRINLPDMMEVQDALKRSHTYEFIEQNKAISSAINGKTTRCWIFRKANLTAQAED